MSTNHFDFSVVGQFGPLLPRFAYSASLKYMGSVNLELASDLVSVARLGQGDVSQEAAKLIALELFREDKVSLGRAAELCPHEL